MNELINIVFIGESEVGKSTLVYGLAKDGVLKSYTPTIGIDFKDILLSLDNNKSIKCRLWDMSGSDKFRDDRNSYYKSANIICIVINANQPDSYQIQKIQYYRTEVETHNPKAKILVIANNKRKLLSAIELTEEHLKHARIELSQYIVVSAHEIALQVLSGQKTALENKLATLIENIVGPAQLNPPMVETNGGHAVRKTPSFEMELSTLGERDMREPQILAKTTALSSLNFFSNFFSTKPNVNHVEFRATLAAIKQLSKGQAELALNLIYLHLKDGPLRNPNKPYHIGVFGLSGTREGSFKNKNLASTTTQEREIHFKSNATYTENGMIWLSMTMPFSRDCLALNLLTPQELDELDGRLVLLTLYNDVVLFSDGLWNVPLFRHTTTHQFYKDLPRVIEKQIIIASQIDDDVLTKTPPAAAVRI